MSKLYFRYGAMNCGKTTLLLAVAHNYEERDMFVKVLKPIIDTKGGNKITTRIGLEREADYLINDTKGLKDYLKEISKENISCILVDESQFLTKDMVDELFIFTKKYDIPVICYGLRTDFTTTSFEGSKRLMELSDEMEELVTICRCGQRAKFNGRMKKGKFIVVGDSVSIDGADDDIRYESLCGKCYLEKVLNISCDKEYY